MDLFVPDKYSQHTEDLFSSTDLFDTADTDNGDFSLDCPKDVFQDYSQYLTNTIPAVQTYYSNIKIQDQSEAGEMGVDNELNLVYKSDDRYLLFPKQDVTEIKIKDLDMVYFNLYLGESFVTFEFSDLDQAKAIKRFFVDDEVTLKELPTGESERKDESSLEMANDNSNNVDSENTQVNQESENSQVLEIDINELSEDLAALLKSPISGQHTSKINQAFKEKQEAIYRANEIYLETIRSILAKPCSLCFDENATKRNSSLT